MALKIVLLAGDGVGPEVMREGVKVLKAVESAYGVSFDLVPFPCGGQYYMDTGAEWPDGAFESCKAADAILLGAVGLPDVPCRTEVPGGGGAVSACRSGFIFKATCRRRTPPRNVYHRLTESSRRVWEPA